MKKQIILKWIFISAIFGAAALWSYSQSTKSIGSFQHKLWTIDDGLPMNTVMSIAQTKDGYLWLGTETGVAQFDGVKFENFNHENTPAFTSDIILAMMVDRSDRLWIVPRGGGLIRFQDGSFEALTKFSGMIGKEVWCIIESVDGSTWIGSNTGLTRIRSGEPVKIPLPGNFSGRAVTALLEDRNGALWVGCKNGGLALIKKSGSGYESEYIGLPGMEITTLFEDRKGTLWIGTVENGLYRYSEDQLNPVNDDNNLAAYSIRCFYEDRFGNLWIGTHGGGIKVLIQTGNSAGKYRVLNFPYQEDFASSIILAFYEDREGTLWVGTNGGGLVWLRESKITTYTMKNGLSYNNIYGVFQDSRQRIWCGTKGFGVNYLTPGEERFYTLSTKNGLSSDSVITFAQDLTGCLWFGTLGGGINRYRNEKIEVFTFSPGLSNNSFRAVYVDPAGRILAGNVNGAIYEFKNGGFSQIADVKSRVNMLFRDSRGVLWACTMDNGLCRINPPPGQLEFFNVEKGLSNNVATCIREDRNGIFWIGTVQGLNRFQDGVIAHLYKKHGIPDDTVYWMLEDHKEDFWISSNQGVYCLSREELDAFFNGEIAQVNPLVFGKETGLLSIECNGGNQPSGWHSTKGRLWFPTTHGVSLIDPRHVGVNRVPPPVVIEKIIINGKQYPVSKRMKVPPGRNNLQINYTALSFIVPTKIRFKYKMVGYDRKWTEVQNIRTLYYNDLPPGKYSFQVTACNSNGVWNYNGVKIEIQLKPLFYQTLTFKIHVIAFAAAFLLGLLFFLRSKFIYFLRQRKIKSKGGRSNLTPDEAQKHIRRIIYLLEEEKIYKDSNLSIKTLACRLVITPRVLSQIINDRLKNNFHDLVTAYRIKEAQRLLTDPKMRDKSILEIAYDLGYNSKSAFNRAFKDIVGSTPSCYRKSAFDKSSPLA